MSLEPTLEKIKEKHRLAEMIIFPEWQKASPKKREEITRKLGEVEAKEILEEIERLSNLKYPQPKRE